MEIDFKFGKMILTLLFWLAVILILMSQFFWLSETLGRVLLNFPELRRYAYEERYAQFGTQRAFQSQFFLQNRGRGKALDVDLYVVVPGGVITRYDALCQVPCEVNAADVVRGRLHIQLDHLVSDAQVKLYVWGFQSASPNCPIDFAVTARNGMVRELDVPTITESMDSYVQLAAQLTNQLLDPLLRKFEAPTLPVAEAQPESEGGLPTVLECTVGIIILCVFGGATVYLVIRATR
jgi:hypothetical protein